MSTITGFVQDAVRGAACFLADVGTIGPGIADRLVFRDLRRPPGSEPALDYFANAAGGIRDLICADGPQAGAPVPQPPVTPPNVIGGQCDTLYQLTLTASYLSGFFGDRQTRVTTNNVTGPLGNVQVIQDGAVVRWVIQTGTGEVQLDSVTESLGSATEGAVDNVVNPRVDGLPDDCGSPPIEPEPPVWRYPVPDPGDPTGPPIDIDLDIPVIIIGPGGEIEFNFGINIGSIPITFVYAPGGGDPERRSPDDPYDCCPPLDEIDPPAPENPEEPDEPEDDRRFDYVICSTPTRPLLPGGATEKGNGLGPSIYLPSLAEIRFKVITPRGRSWTQAVKIQGLNEVIEVPVRFPAYGWNVDEYQNVPITVTPIYNAVEDS